MLSPGACQSLNPRSSSVDNFVGNLRPEVSPAPEIDDDHALLNLEEPISCSKSNTCVNVKLP
jgi:hypothetical protein